MTTYAMGIDMNRCVGCQTCVVACQLNHGTPPGIAWNSVDAIEWGRWPECGRAYFSHACYHCDDPLCVVVCPTGASAKCENGIVGVNQDLCIGCGVCLTACQYGARSLPKGESYFFAQGSPAPYEAYHGQPSGVAQKCDFCQERIAHGQQPWCVESCFCGARVFGDLDDESSPICTFITEQNPQHVTGTALYYAGVPEAWDLQSAATNDYYKPGLVGVEKQAEKQG